MSIRHTNRVTDNEGDPITPSHVLPLPDTDTDIYGAAPLAVTVGLWQAQVDGERFAAEHANCEAPWECAECGRPVCPRCDPSPAEFIRCAECDWFRGGAA